MSEIMKKATEMLWEMVGQDKVMALATRNGEGVASRTINGYAFGGRLYFITEEHSNKYVQITANPQVAFSVDAIQITGNARALEHPLHESNQQFRAAVEASLPGQFERYREDAAMRLLEVVPDKAGFISLETGEGFAIDFGTGKAVQINRE